MLDGDGHTLHDGAHTLAVDNQVNAHTLHGSHGVVVEVHIIRTASNAVLDVVDAGDVQRRVGELTGASVRDARHPVCAMADSLPGGGFRQQRVALSDSQRSIYPVSVDGLPVNRLGVPQAVNDVSRIVHLDDVGVCRQVSMVHTKHVGDVLQRLKVEVHKGIAEIDVVLHEKAVALKRALIRRAVSTFQHYGQVVEIAEAGRDIDGTECPGVHALHLLHIRVADAVDNHARLAGDIGEVAVLGKLHVCTRMRRGVGVGVAHLLAHRLVLETALARAVRREDPLHPEI